MYSIALSVCERRGQDGRMAGLSAWEFRDQFLEGWFTFVAAGSDHRARGAYAVSSHTIIVNRSLFLYYSPPLSNLLFSSSLELNRTPPSAKTSLSRCAIRRKSSSCSPNFTSVEASCPHRHPALSASYQLSSSVRTSHAGSRYLLTRYLHAVTRSWAGVMGQYTPLLRLC
ncbi:hypothetical protein BDW22DRAFT_1160496 [Trametopsis cervina]|nr:hypothetical protein BDW22DRAFT_1160496 [Trametopsis cervina]